MDQWEHEKIIHCILAHCIGIEADLKELRARIDQPQPARLANDDVARIAAAVSVRIGDEIARTGHLESSEILTTEQAMVYAKRRSSSAFNTWCKRWWIKPHQRGRYSRTQLDLALSREARLRG